MVIAREPVEPVASRRPVKLVPLPIEKTPEPLPKSRSPVTVPALTWTVSLPEPSSTSPPIFGVIAVLAFAFWTRVTPVVLWLRSRATILPAVTFPVDEGASTPPMALVLVTLLSVPDRSMIAAALPMSPVRAPLIAPVLVTLDRVAPASIRMPVAWEARLEVETPEMTPSFLRVGMVTPPRIWMAVPLSWKPWPEMVLDEAT